jgi:hypothetical protein
MKVRQSINNLNISPIIGKFTSEKVAIGVQLNIGFSGSNIKDGPQNKIFSLGASPFIRYYLYKWNKVSMFINGSVGTGFSNSKVTYADSTYDKPKLFSVYSEVVPGLSYDVNDHLILQTSLSYFGLNYNYSYSKDITGTRKESKFNIGGGLGYILSFNAITIGALYKF